MKGKGGLKLNRKLCTSIKTRRGDIKSYTPVPGDRMQERGTQWKATVQSDSRAFSLSQGEVEETETGQLCLIMYLELV